MRRIFISMLVAMCGILIMAAPEGPRTRVSVTSQPEGAIVLMDGAERGVTPIMLFDLEPGRHHAKLRLAGHVERDCVFTLNPGGSATVNETLPEETGLLLLKTEPAGCNITVNGVSIGETPRFIGNLTVKGKHVIKLSKPGYQDQLINVQFNGREPLVREEKMVLDSGVVDFVTDPAGAEVMVNGVVRGVTPTHVSGIPKGTAVVKFRLDGYREETREIRLNAGDCQTLSVPLTGLPGTLHLTSQPAGASFYLNGEARGRDPLTIPALPPGDYEVRCEKDGYAALVRTVTIRNGAAAREEFRLSNVMGRIEVRTTPPGAEVFLDGRRVGVTKAGGDEAAERSDVFAIENVMAGEHAIVIRKDGFHDLARTVHVKAKTTVSNHRLVLRRAFIPDIEVTTLDEKIRGIFKSKDAETIIIERSPGMDYPIPLRTVRKIEYLSK